MAEKWDLQLADCLVQLWAPWWDHQMALELVATLDLQWVKGLAAKLENWVNPLQQGPVWETQREIELA